MKKESTIKEKKQKTRAIIKAVKKSFTKEELNKLSEEKISQLEEDALFKTAKTILLFYSLDDEVNTHDLIEKWSNQKTILLPIVKGDEIELRSYTDKNDLVEGAYHIMEPKGELFEQNNLIDLAIIPGIAFDNEGNRLGRGKGYYDRFLSKAQSLNIPTLGLCFDFQRINHIPIEKHDIPIDRVL